MVISRLLKRVTGEQKYKGIEIRKVVDLHVVCKGFVYVKNNGWNTDLYMSVVHNTNAK